MSEGQGVGTQGANTQTQNGNNGQGNGSQGNSGQGNESPKYVTLEAFETLTTKLDDVLADNLRYRQERRQGKQGNSGQSTNQQGNNQNGNESGNTGNANTANVSAEVETLRQELRTERFRNDIISAATAAGALNPSRIPQILSMEDLADEKGNVPNAAKALETLKKSDPYLFGRVVQGGGDGGAGNGDDQGTQPKSMNQLIRQAAKRN